MNLDQAADVLLVWARANVDTGTEVILANPNAPRPGLPFVTLLVSQGAEFGQPSISGPDVNGISHVIKDVDVTLSLQAFGPGAKTIAERLYHSLDLPSNEQFFQSLPYVDKLTALRDLSAVSGTTMEPRAGFDSRFRMAVEIADDVGFIERVLGHGTVDSQGFDIDMGV